MSRRGKVYIAIMVGIVLMLIITMCRSCAGGDSKESTPHRTVKKSLRRQSINEFISNDLSSLEQTKKFDKNIESFMKRWELTGATFALMRNDSLLYVKGYGYADKEHEQGCEANSLFRIASVSKLITATTVMKLIESGRLSLSSQVFGKDGIINDSIFLNLRNPNLTRITVEHLLRHTAGFSSPHGDPAFANYSIARQVDKPLPLTLDDIVLYATQNRLRYQPGGKFDYSNMGYMLLEKVIEKVSGMGYEEYVQDSILAPAGCYNMFIGRNYARNRAKNEVRYYEVKEATKVPAYDGSDTKTMKSDGGNNVTLLGGAGGWVTSSAELIKFVAAINNSPQRRNILSDESIRTMTKSSKTMHPIGWASTNQGEWCRSGSMAGTSAYVKQQKDGYTWVFISNSSAWIGPNISKYISSRISRYVAQVEEWPVRDMFGLSPSEEM